MAIARELLSAVEAFRELAPAALAEIAEHLVVEPVARGEALVRQGEPSTALFIVASGRFHVWRAGDAEPVAEIGAGSPVGEIGFFAGGPRTATVRAERDSLVLRLSREDFDALAAREPRLWPSIAATLAGRLARTTAGVRVPRRQRPRTLCLLPAGDGVGPDGIWPRGFPDALIAELRQLYGGEAGQHGGDATRVLVLDAAAAAAGACVLPGDDGGIAWLNDLEARHDLVLLLAGGDDDWSRKAVRQADVVLTLARTGAGVFEPRALERLAGSLHRPPALWLVLVRDEDAAPSGTAAWLASRPWIGRHHHAVAGRAADVRRIARFVAGRAVGFVACGGGAFCPSHIGVYEALVEAGIEIDAFGGTSGGAAMAAAFAAGRSADEIERATQDIFVRQRAMGRWTLPRYSLLDHSVFEAALREHYTDIDIADLPLPFFAVSTNLSAAAPVLHARGPLWWAIRASSAIPALLPPVVTPDGDMLVDGCLVDNVPVAAMRELKLGPNYVVDFLVPGAETVAAPAATLPTRSELAWRSLTRAGRSGLPQAPSPQAVLMRALMLNASDVRGRLAADDMLIEVPMPDGASHLDWQRHRELRRRAREFTRRLLAGRRSQTTVEKRSPATEDRGRADRERR